MYDVEKRFVVFVLRTVSIIVVTFVALNAWYVYKQLDEPLDGIIDESQRFQPPPGMTFEEFWQDRIDGYREIDERSDSGSEFCSNEAKYYWMPKISFMAVLGGTFTSLNPNGFIAQSYFGGGWMPIPEKFHDEQLKVHKANWWAIANLNWEWFTKRSGTDICDLPAPQRPVDAQ
ncbi:MAG: hypothetical protein JEZ06_15090 [Anaerolineaceae bacterium]|nr:hypothetical protein [Anaerolineaceae bacterium]